MKHPFEPDAVGGGEVHDHVVVAARRVCGKHLSGHGAVCRLDAQIGRRRPRDGVRSAVRARADVRHAVDFVGLPANRGSEHDLRVHVARRIGRERLPANDGVGDIDFVVPRPALLNAVGGDARGVRRHRNRRACYDCRDCNHFSYVHCCFPFCCCPCGRLARLSTFA